jgi:hypothetical protein
LNSTAYRNSNYSNSTNSSGRIVEFRDQKIYRVEFKSKDNNANENEFIVHVKKQKERNMERLSPLSTCKYSSRPGSIEDTLFSGERH